MPKDGRRIYLLGGFRVEVDGDVVLEHSTRPAAANIVKLLAIQRRHALRREQLCATLWPQLSEDGAANALYKNLHFLRSSLLNARYTEELVATKRGAVQLATDVWIDVDEFTESASALRRGDASTELHEAALTLYGGDLLPDDLLEEWTEPHRDLLRETCQRIRRQLAGFYSINGDYERAMGVLNAMVETDKTDEAAHRELIRLLDLLGYRDRALRQYQRCRVALARELDVEPSEETEALVASVRSAPPRDMNGPLARPTVRPRYDETYTEDGVRISYWQLGEGSPLIHLPMGGLSHIQMEIEMPLTLRWYEALAQFTTLVRYDMRGFGSSNRADALIDQRSPLRDLEAVWRALGEVPVRLFATLNQSRTAIQFAARHPEAVDKVILWSSFGPRASEHFQWGKDAKFEQLKYTDWRLFVNAWAQAIWGWRMSEHARLWARMMRLGASAAALDRFNEASMGTDVLSDLPDVQAKVLVAGHTTAADSVRFAESWANGLPNAQLIVLDDFYAAWADPGICDRAIDIVRTFLETG